MKKHKADTHYNSETVGFCDMFRFSSFVVVSNIFLLLSCTLVVLKYKIAHLSVLLKPTNQYTMLAGHFLVEYATDSWQKVPYFGVEPASSKCCKIRRSCKTNWNVYTSLSKSRSFSKYTEPYDATRETTRRSARKEKRKGTLVQEVLLFRDYELSVVSRPTLVRAYKR